MRTVPTGRSGDFTTPDDAGNLSLDVLFAAERARAQGEMDRLLDDMLDDLHRAMRRAERASAAMTARLNAGDFDGAQDCADEFRAAMAEFGGFLRESYGAIKRERQNLPAEIAHIEEMASLRMQRALSRGQSEVNAAVAIIGLVIFGWIFFHSGNW